MKHGIAVPTELREARENIAAKRRELATIFEQAGSDNDLSKAESLKNLTDTAARVEAIRGMNDELADLVAKAAPMEQAHAVLVTAAREAEKSGGVEQHPGHATEGEGAPARKSKSIGSMIAGAELLKHRHAEVELDVSADGVKTLFETGNGWQPETTRDGTLVPLALSNPLQAIDLIPSTTTTQSALLYMQETAFSDNAAETAEGGAYPEATLEVAEVSSPVRKVSVFLAVTDEQLEDVEQGESYINNRLPLMIQRRLSRQVLSGNGTPPNLDGILSTAGIQQQDRETDSLADAVYKGITKVNTIGDAVADGVVVNPTNWQDVVLAKTTDGIYIWGHPSLQGPQTLWGLPVALDASLASASGGTQLVGDFRTYSALAVKRGMTVKLSDSHADFFTNGKQAIRADLRAALAVYRPAAFCEVKQIP